MLSLHSFSRCSCSAIIHLTGAPALPSSISPGRRVVSVPPILKLPTRVLPPAGKPFPLVLGHNNVDVCFHSPFSHFPVI